MYNSSQHTFHHLTLAQSHVCLSHLGSKVGGPFCHLTLFYWLGFLPAACQSKTWMIQRVDWRAFLEATVSSTFFRTGRQTHLSLHSINRSTREKGTLMGRSLKSHSCARAWQFGTPDFRFVLAALRWEKQPLITHNTPRPAQMINQCKRPWVFCIMQYFRCGWHHSSKLDGRVPTVPGPAAMSLWRKAGPFTICGRDVLRSLRVSSYPRFRFHFAQAMISESTAILVGHFCPRRPDYHKIDVRRCIPWLPGCILGTNSAATHKCTSP